MTLLNRRDFLIAGTATSALGLADPAIAAPPTMATSGAASRPKLTITEQLMYSTVRLYNQTGNNLRWGTGFFFELFHAKNFSVPVIVTNRHVVEGWDTCSFSFEGESPSGGPDYDHQLPMQLPNFENLWISHPEADLVIIPIEPLRSRLRQSGGTPFWVPFEQSIIPTDSELEQLTPVEQIITVGFPGLLWDQTHNLPVFHRGYTATAPYIDFDGKQVFLIDIATWPGSSGSPVMLYNDNGWTDRNGQTFLGAVRAKLLGLVFQVAEYDVQGKLVLQNGPTEAASFWTPTNLGACIRASRILEFEPLLVRMGLVKPPPGYVMRAV
jgi:hypothetical protein